MNLYKVRPFLTFKVWGGSKLLGLRGLNTNENSNPLGETWEVSIHPDGESTVESGQKLSNLIEKERLPYLIKFIDTSDNLSVQVHPGQEYARKVENDNGKNECWIILDAEEGSGIYLGFKEGVTEDLFNSYILENKDVDSLLNFYPVKRGDFFFIPAGSVHAIGKNITLCEVQRSSGVTYRIWDWNRLDNGKPRELHLKKAFDVLEFDSKKNKKEFFQFKEDIFANESIDLTEDDLFKVKSAHLEVNQSLKVSPSERLTSVVVLKGRVKINEYILNSYESLVLDISNDVSVLALEKSELIVVS